MGTDVKLSSEFTIIYGGEVIAYCTDFTLEKNKEVIDITKLGDTWKNKKVDTKDFSVSFNGMITRGDTVTALLWNVATAYTVGQYVVIAGKAWEAQGSTTGDNPTTDDGTNWLETSEWLVGTTYAADDLVYITSVSQETRIYKSLQGSNTGNDPLTETAYWERLESNYESLLKELANNDTVVTCTIKPSSTSETYYYGDGILNSLSASFGVGDKATYSGGFAGSGELSTESYGPVLNVSTCVNSGVDPYDTFANATATGFDAISDGSGIAKAATADEIPFVSGTQYFVEFDAVLNSGTAPTYQPRSGIETGDVVVEGAQTVVNGSNSFLFTCDVTTTGVLRFYSTAAATNYEITNLSVRAAL